MTALRAQDFSTAFAVLFGAGLLAWVIHRDLGELTAAVQARAPSSSTEGIPAVPAQPGLPGVPQALPALPTLPPAPGLPMLPGAPMPPAAQLPADVLERDKVYRRRDDAQLLLIQQRAEYAKVCWGAAVGARTPRPPSIKLTVDFDATGREVARRARMALPHSAGSVEERLLACVESDKPPRLKVTPPGKPESIELSLSFP